MPDHLMSGVGAESKYVEQNKLEFGYVLWGWK